MVGVLSGCSSTQPIELPDWDIPKASTEIQDPIPLPPLDFSEGEASFDETAAEVLRDFEKTAIVNQEIALANNRALVKQSEAYNSLIEAGKMQRQIAQIRQELLDIERSQHKYDNWFYRTVIAVGALLVAAFAL